MSHAERTLVWLCLLSLVACNGSQQTIGLRQDAFEKIDVHTHYFAPRSYLLPMLERWNARAVILNYTLGEPDSLVRRRWADVLALAHGAPDRFWVATTFDPTAIDRPDFASRTLARLRTDFADGAVMLKVWKDLGLMVRDRSGRFVQIDDPRLQPIWDFLSAQHMPVLEHSADPREGWRPLDPTSPNFEYFRTNPDHYPYLHPDVSRWETVIAARDRWLARNPSLTVIGAHFGRMADDLDALSRCLDLVPKHQRGRVRSARRHEAAGRSSGSAGSSSLIRIASSSAPTALPRGQKPASPRRRCGRSKSRPRLSTPGGGVTPAAPFDCRRPC